MTAKPIVIVENGRQFADLLRARGHVVSAARDGDGALGLLATEEACLVVLDLSAPQLDAFETCGRARKLIGPATPIVLLAPPNDPGLLHSVLQNGATDYLLKVEKPEALVERLEALVFGHDERDHAATAGDQDLAPALASMADELELTVPADDLAPAQVARSAAASSAARASGDTRTTRPSPRPRGQTSRTARQAPTRDSRRLRLAKWTAIALGVLWLVGAGYNEFLRRDPMQTVRSVQLKRQIDSCRGTFNARYKCKSSLMISSENRMFGVWTKKIGIVFIPILALSVFYHSVLLRLWRARRSR